ncbi:hypothetical protein [Phormidesmis priestleyi]
MDEKLFAQQNEKHETERDRRTSQTPTHKTRIYRKEPIDQPPRSLCAPGEMQPNGIAHPPKVDSNARRKD